jgi:hypothetical protein
MSIARKVGQRLASVDWRRTLRAALIGGVVVVGLPSLMGSTPNCGGQVNRLCPDSDSEHQFVPCYDNYCPDVLSDPENCNGCGVKCAEGEVCSAGVCAKPCADGQTACAGACVDLATNAAHCGACGNACAPGVSCVSFTCGGAPDGGVVDGGGCGAPLIACGACVDPRNDPQHCGSCGHACAGADNAWPVCIASSCALSCKAGFLDCNGQAADGCEVDAQHDAAHCGGCGVACSPGQTCAAGVCTGGATCSPPVVIQEVYPYGGSAAGSSYFADFVVLHNRSNSPQSLAGWTLQVNDGASQTGWNVTSLNTTLPPGGYWLLRFGGEGLGGTFYVADQIGGSFNLPGAAGRVALVHGVAPLNGVCPPADDFVGYGQGTCAEGSPVLVTDQYAAVRASPCQDSGNNAADFAVGAALVQNSTSATLTCAACP